jgi:cyanocobalamin reductase (cyanide-eliminating) / alkylcobalamin dealkylase
VSDWESIAARLRMRCGAAGFDLVAPLRPCWYRKDAAAPPVPELGGDDRLALVIGNTRDLWPRFVEFLRRHRDWLDRPDPLEAYSELYIAAAVRQAGIAQRVLWAHDVTPRAIPIQRLAHAAGLAFLTPANLCVHPQYGPWIALRAVAVFDVEGPPGPPAPVPICSTCAETCRPALARAVYSDPNDPQAWKLWLAVRDGCPLGRQHRYGEDQLVYHYTKDRAALRRAVESAAASSAG